VTLDLYPAVSDFNDRATAKRGQIYQWYFELNRYILYNPIDFICQVVYKNNYVNQKKGKYD